MHIHVQYIEQNIDYDMKLHDHDLSHVFSSLT